MAIAITAAQGGLLTAQSAAAVIIGANIGTTLTAVLAAIGATPNAKRAATAHVAFNLVAAGVALALLPWLVEAIASARAALGLVPDPAQRLATFHTVFNVLGVLLMWPLSRPLTRWLQRRFRAHEDDEAHPRHLDETVLAVPSLAIDAFEREVARIGHVASRIARAALAGAEGRALQRDQSIAAALVATAEAFVERVSRGAMSPHDSGRLAAVLRIQRYHEAVIEQALLMSPLTLPPVHDQALIDRHAALLQAAQRLFAVCDPAGTPAIAPEVDEAAEALEAAYQALKAALLDSGASGSARLTEMDDALRRYSALRRAAQQAAKAWQHRAPLLAAHPAAEAAAAPRPTAPPPAAS
jgi:phosphate:Na+ symporter